MMNLSFLRGALWLICTASIVSIGVPSARAGASLTSQQKIELKAALRAEAERFEARLATVETYYKKEKDRLVIAREQAKDRELAGVTDRVQGKAIRNKCEADKKTISKQVNTLRLKDRDAEKEIYKQNLVTIKAGYGVK